MTTMVGQYVPHHANAQKHHDETPMGAHPKNYTQSILCAKSMLRKIGSIVLCVSVHGG